jgi:oligoribonuclease
MKYLSIDIETTGLSSENHQILSIGVVVEDTTKKLPLAEIPKFHCAIVDEDVKGSIFALNLNKELINTINLWNISNSDIRSDLEEKTGMIFYKRDEVCEHLFRFLYRNGILDSSVYNSEMNKMVTMYENDMYPAITRVTKPSQLNVAGKNFATFDKLFLEQLPRWKQLFKIRQRIIDPTLLFTKWNEDEALPSLTTCKERANTGGEVTHDAIEDAWDVIQLLRTQY